MPAGKGIPTPMATLGDIAGAPTKLPYSSEVYEYNAPPRKSAPKRVRTWNIGKTEEGRDHIAVAIGSDALMARYEENKAKLAEWPDPRSINFDDARPPSRAGSGAGSTTSPARSTRPKPARPPH